MSHLHATLRALVSAGMAIEEILKIASRTFCQSSLPAQFATLVLGKADQAGNVEFVDAGHTPVLLNNSDEIAVIDAASVPLGLFCTTEFAKTHTRVEEGGLLLAYSDGITEAANPAGDEYGLDRLLDDFREHRNLSPDKLVQSISHKVTNFSGSLPFTDDRTILVLGR
jgi:sigma-B regulation protein RsbU (phosphoserine phosphatase)